MARLSTKLAKHIVEHGSVYTEYVVKTAAVVKCKYEKCSLELSHEFLSVNDESQVGALAKKCIA